MGFIINYIFEEPIFLKKLLTSLLVVLGLFGLFSTTASHAATTKTYVSPQVGQLDMHTYQGKTHWIPAIYWQMSKHYLSGLTVSTESKHQILVAGYFGDAKTKQVKMAKKSSKTASQVRFSGAVRYFACLYPEKAFTKHYVNASGDKIQRLLTAITTTTPIVNPNKKSTQLQTVPVLYQLTGVNKTSTFPINWWGLYDYQKEHLTSLKNSILNQTSFTMKATTGNSTSVGYQSAVVTQVTVDPLHLFRQPDPSSAS